MDFKEQAHLIKFIESQEVFTPKVILVSGVDLETGENLNKRLQSFYKKKVGHIEVIVFAEEDKEETYKFKTEVEQVPLFGSFRYIIVRHANFLLSSFLESKQDLKKNFSLNNLPEQTIIIFLYEGTPTKNVLNYLNSAIYFYHLQTQKLYQNQFEDALQKSLHHHKIKLSEQAFYFLLDNIEAKIGVIDQITEKLNIHFKDKIANESGPTIDDIKTILFPQTTSGWDIFSFVDNLFLGNQSQVIREYKRYNTKTDNLFVVLKLICKRLDEIRFANIAFKNKMSEKEIMINLGHANKHPYIQKKTLTRLNIEVQRFPIKRILLIYETLINLQKKFRREASEEKKQIIYFQEVCLKTFLSRV